MKYDVYEVVENDVGTYYLEMNVKSALGQYKYDG